MFVVISSLKLLINCDTCVRASPVSCAAAGSCVSWLRRVACGGQMALHRLGIDLLRGRGRRRRRGRGLGAPGLSRDCAGVAVAGAAGSAGVAVGWLGAGRRARGAGRRGVAVAGDGDAVEAAALALAALALADVLGSSCSAWRGRFARGRAPPLIAAANAVTCVRTSCSLVRADSSSAVDGRGLAARGRLRGRCRRTARARGSRRARARRARAAEQLGQDAIGRRNVAAPVRTGACCAARWCPTLVSATPPVRACSSASSARRRATLSCQSVTPRGCRQVPTAPDADARSQTPAACLRRACDLSAAPVAPVVC